MGKQILQILKIHNVYVKKNNNSSKNSQSVENSSQNKE